MQMPSIVMLTTIIVVVIRFELVNYPSRSIYVEWESLVVFAISLALLLPMLLEIKFN